MIVTVTLNPSLFVHYDAEQVALGTVNRVSRVRYATGGRGLAVARLLSTFGHEVVATGLAGGATGELIRNELARAGVVTLFTRINAESRRVVRVDDTPTGVSTTFEEPPPYITTEELGRLAADYLGLLDGATAVVLCGSLPAGLPAEIYGSLTSYASSAGVPVILDAGGSALRHGIARGPALVIPEVGPGVTAVAAAGPSAVVLTTQHGVRAITAAGEWHAAAGAVAKENAADLSARGLRDALVAGFVPGIALGWSWPDMLRHAVALAASASEEGEVDLVAYEKLLPEVTVTRPRSAASRSERKPSRQV